MLPDGRWFGFPSSVEFDSFSFDLACWFSGDEAILAADADGAESPPPNDYHIRNDNDTRRLVVPAEEVEVTWLPEPGDPASTKTVDYPTWTAGWSARSFQPGAWIEIEGGLVVAIEEQYQP